MIIEEVTMTLDEAIKTAKKECKNPYATAYIENVGKSAVDHGTEGLTIQLSYFLANATKWRGETAREAKKVMKEFVNYPGHKGRGLSLSTEGIA
jgi:hypothetical protein